MISVAGRGASLATVLKSSSNAIKQSQNLGWPALLQVESSVVSPNRKTGSWEKDPTGTVKAGIKVMEQTHDELARDASVANPPIFKKSAMVKPEVFREIRDAVGSGHYDLKMANFDEFRRPETLDPTYDAREDLEGKKALAYMFIGTGFAASGYLAKNVLRSVAAYLYPGADAIAAGITELELDAIPEGSSLTFKWRGKPLFVKHRTAEMIAAEGATDLSTLRDPEHDNERCTDPKYLIVVGVCTHLGCVPIHNAGDWGGFYCPCHGSHYDNAGRIRQGPAPLNLEVPPYSFPKPGICLVGD